MKILAWVVLVLSGLGVLITPFFIGTKFSHETWRAEDALRSMIRLAILLPLCGRILGWW